MSIRIIPQKQREQQNSGGKYPAVAFPRLKNFYRRRAARLRQRAEKNPLGDYLLFVAKIAKAQEIVLYDHLLHTPLPAVDGQGKTPLNIHSLARNQHWQRLLHSLIAGLKPEMTGQALAVLENLEKIAATELESMASALFACEFSQVGSDKSPFIRAALSVYWAQMVAYISGQTYTGNSEWWPFYPVCASMSVTSVIRMDVQRDGLHYLHCNLCESE